MLPKSDAEASRFAGERVKIAARVCGFARIAIRLEKAWAKTSAVMGGFTPGRAAKGGRRFGTIG